jgi:hypothetical protein
MSDIEQVLRVQGAPPEHGPGFEERLRAAVAADTGGAGEQAGRDRAPAAALTVHTRRRVRWVAALAAAAVVTASVIGYAAARHTVTELQQPQPASAAEVVANVQAALSRISTLRAHEVWTFRQLTGPQESEWRSDWTTADWWARTRIGRLQGVDDPPDRIIVAADGRWRMDHPEGDGIVSTYTGDELTGVLKSYERPDRTEYVATGYPLEAGSSLGGLDAPVLSLYDGVWGNGSWGGWGDVWFVFAFNDPANLSAMAGGQVAETTYEGRPALTLSVAIAPTPITGLDMGAHLFDTVRIVVDRRTWLVVDRCELLRGEVVYDTRLTDVHVNEPLGGTSLVPTLPAGTKVKTSHDRFRHVSFAAAATAFATPALAPGRLPSGYSPFAAAVAPSSRFTLWTQNGYRPDYWPESHDITQLSYRSGLLHLMVTTRRQPAGTPAPDDDPQAADPFVTTTPGDDTAATGALETVTLTGGAWQGVTAHLVMPLLDTPHLWAWHDGTLVTVSGDLTRDELLSVADSLEPLR